MIKKLHNFFKLMLIISTLDVVTLELTTSDILELYGNIKTYEYPTNHSDFYHAHFENGGIYGTYDFIIVGAGSAGTILANRLAENSAWKILLLEGGGEEPEIAEVAGVCDALQFTNINWGYRSTKQEKCCLAMDDQKCNIPRGKALGGSSTINFMVYVRGNKKDYDLWAEAGNPGWSYDDILPYLIDMENSTLTENVDESYHGKNGTLDVETAIHFTELGQAFLDANVEMGRKILDYNGKEQMGYSRPQLTTRRGRRCSGNTAFLKPVRNRENLSIVTKAFVTKIIIDKEEKVANGVQFVIGNKTYQAYATREVILSAGALGSPNLLLLSGIGPKKHLEELDIPVIQDLPVGRNLADHQYFFQVLHSNFVDPGLKPMDEMFSQFQEGKGLLTNPGNKQAMGFMSTKNTDYPDIEQIYMPFSATNDGVLDKGVGINSETMKIITEEFPKGDVTIFLVLQHPKSRGSITLKSNNPFDFPLIDLNYFDDEEDVEVLLESIKDLVHQVDNAQSLKKYNISFPEKPIPGCKEPYLSDDYWRCAIRHLSSTLYHQMGTCKMGPDTDPEAVVDHELRVKGIKNLRVADTSVIPITITGHTNVPAFAVGAKASDLLKKKHKF